MSKIPKQWFKTYKRGEQPKIIRQIVVGEKGMRMVAGFAEQGHMVILNQLRAIK